MGIRILSGTRINEGDGMTGAVLYCSTTGLAFGPLFTDEGEADEFLTFAFLQHGDVRQFPSGEVARLVDTWRASKRRTA